jgi:ATP-dependent DNA helicase RecG
MKIAQLRSLIKRGESERLEFKQSTASLSVGMQTVCAFLNSDHGGTVIFGVTDDGKLVGQIVTDKTRKEIAVQLSKIEPYVKIDVHYVHVADTRQAIVFSVEPGERAPYIYDGRPFARNQSTTARMTQEEYIYIYNRTNPTIWEKSTSNTCTLRDLDSKRIREIVRMAVQNKRLPSSAVDENVADVLKKLELIIDGKLTNAAVILFCKKESKQFIQSNVKLARFRGTTKTEFRDKKDFRMNAFDIFDKATDFLDFCLPVAARIEPGNPIRIEEPAVPYSVLREALTNALIHRDYSYPGGSISVAVYDDCVNISNTGHLPRGVLLKELSKPHQSVQRNPLIAHVFYVCGKIERWGRGTLDMIKDCKAVGNPLPQYEEVGGGFSVTLPLKEPIRTVVTKETPHADVSRLTERQKEILSILKTEALTRQQLMKKMHEPLTDRTVQRELAKLMEMRFIKSEGKARSVLWSLVH